MSILSARLGFAKPSLSDEANIEDSFASMEDTLDSAAMWDTGTYALRPVSTPVSPGIAGRLYRATDTGDLFLDVGNAWRYAGKMLGEVFALPCAVSADMVTDGLLPCDGRLVAKIGTYARLFARIGHAYNGGVDPGSGNFRIPDLRGNTLVGPDDMGGGDAGRLTSNQALGASGGEEKHVLTVDEMPTHTHPLEGSTAGASNAPGPFTDRLVQENRNASDSDSGSVQPTGAGVPHNNMQPYQVLTWAIRAA